MTRTTSAAADPLLRVLVVGDADPLEAVTEAVTRGFDSVSLVRERALSSAVARVETVDPHCVVCGFDPGGRSPVERLRAERESVPILAVAADAVGALEAGATDVVDPAAPDPLVVARLGRLAAGERDRPTDESTADYRSILEGSSAVVWLLDGDGEVAYASPATDEELGISPDELEGRSVSQVVHPEDRDAVREAVAAAADGPLGASERVRVRLGRADGARRTAELRASNRLEGIVATVAAEPATEAEQLLERLQRLGETGQDLLGATDREAVYRRLCRGAASLECEDGRIELAWVGAIEGGETLEPRAVAGAGDGRLGSLARRHASTMGRAIPESASADRLTEGADEPWRERALEAGIRSALCVPLRYEGFRYGALVLYSTAPAAFDEPTRRGLERLGRVAGVAIDAMESRRALRGDAVAELEFVLRESEPLASIAHRIGRPLTIRSVVPTDGGGTVFATVPDEADEGGEPDGAPLEAVDGLESVRSVGTVGGQRLLEFRVAEPSVATAVAAHGGGVRTLTPTDDRTRLVLELAGPNDVRTFVGALEREWDLELVARRQRGRSPEKAVALDAALRERLSERQRQTLEAAYYAGFFEWPRETTGEGVADSLGISQPTFSRHLRVAQGTVLSVLFDEFDGLE
ncbi:bacterio-opsin activator domain-containing protein [Natronococcus jeotgali]|uniref:PAS/PAC sensor protein n=1 Tax=Natronococcus jeotgali DSM 18795 TaxID=1227498 RepID=L9WYH4_9EURY|nr:bacterio-opsin activator domain-containing protein [Natronococcus jeotgali]ELY54499.1 PAS/PAC sensor protein [Natronococcus jeotgali DSM 18795]